MMIGYIQSVGLPVPVLALGIAIAVELLGGVALLLYLPLLPAPLRAVLWNQGLQLTCGAGVLLLLAVRWLPRALRRPAFAIGLLLAAIVLGQAGRVSQALAPGVDYQEFPVLH